LSYVQWIVRKRPMYRWNMWMIFA